MPMAEPFVSLAKKFTRTGLSHRLRAAAIPD
jgi:hypothetical protein